MSDTFNSVNQKPTKETISINLIIYRANNGIKAEDR